MPAFKKHRTWALAPERVIPNASQRKHFELKRVEQAFMPALKKHRTWALAPERAIPNHIHEMFITW